VKKKIGIALIVLLVVGAAIGYKAYSWIYDSNTFTSSPYELYIPTGSNYNQVIDALDKADVVKELTSFDAVAGIMKYKNGVKPGRYVIKSGWSNKELIGKLRSGNQDPVQVTISTGRFLNDVAGVVSKKIEADSTSIINALTDEEHLKKLGLTPETAITQVVPNTYEFFWNTDADDFVARMKKESEKFWNADGRQDKLAALKMTSQEVMTLASIVQSESNHKPEQPTMAGVYLNRLRQGIPLEADPTIVFGLRAFTLRRVLYRHINTPNPYNTHLNKGLPPGPICLTHITTIDAVLNAEKHDYIFFCAKPGYNNGHLFAKTNAQHERNARVYHRWLDSEGIRG